MCFGQELPAPSPCPALSVLSVRVCLCLSVLWSLQQMQGNKKGTASGSSLHPHPKGRLLTNPSAPTTGDA